MKIIKANEYNTESHCAAIGFFDGVHTGHHYLIQELNSLARQKKQKSLIITFAVHPRKVLNTNFQPQLLTTLEEKTTLLSLSGVDECAILDFTSEIARLTAYDFMKTILKEQYQVDTLLIGYDHRFGHNRSEGFTEYYAYGKELGMEVVQAKCFSTNLSDHISSSEIRRSLEKGDIEKATAMLGYLYPLSGKVVGGFKVGRKIGFPTANLQPEDPEKIIPGTGVYAVQVLYSGVQYAGMLNIGHRPTLNNGDNISIEVHLIGFDQDIYDQILEIKFIKKIREEKRFDSVKQLIDQLEIDKEEVLKTMAQLNQPE